MWVTTWLSDFLIKAAIPNQRLVCLWLDNQVGFVKNVSYYRCGPLTAAYIDKN